MSAIGSTRSTVASFRTVAGCASCPVSRRAIVEGKTPALVASSRCDIAAARHHLARPGRLRGAGLPMQ
jgi:hypothetical protein